MFFSSNKQYNQSQKYLELYDIFLNISRNLIKEKKMDCYKDYDAITPIMMKKSPKRKIDPLVKFQEFYSDTDNHQDSHISQLSPLPLPQVQEQQFQEEEEKKEKKDYIPKLFDKSKPANQILFLTDKCFNFKRPTPIKDEDFFVPNLDFYQEVEDQFMPQEQVNSSPLILKSISKKKYEKVQLPVECCGRTFTNHQSYGGHRSKKHPKTSDKYAAKMEAKKKNLPNAHRREILNKYIQLCLSQQ
ncbi:hypothetical protein pb186bvf_005996 [Paramecium bursaria]